MPNLSKTAATSAVSGFQNYLYKTGSLTVSSFTLGAFSYSRQTITIPMSNANAISEVQVKLGLDSYWTSVEGVVYRRYPSWSASSYGVDTYCYFTGGNLIVDSYIYDETGASQTIPTFTIDVRAFLYLAPF